MPAYATTTDLIDRYGADEILAVSDRYDPPAGVIDPVVVAKAISDASEEIDGYLARRYALPITGTVPGQIVQLCCAIARFRLRRSMISEDVQNGYDAAVKRLQEIAAGQFLLQIQGKQPVQAGTETSEFASSERVFSQDTMRGF